MDSFLRFRRPVPSKVARPEPIQTTTSDGPLKPSFTNLPPELHLQITSHLIYPDALSLKHTCRYFYYLVDTGVELKVDWLMQRRALHLDCPNNKKCDLGSDLRFCRGSVRLLMQRRREHMECESRPGLGCLVYGTSICTHRRTLKERARMWMRRRLTVEVWWVLLALLAFAMAWTWVERTVQEVQENVGSFRRMLPWSSPGLGEGQEQ